MAIVVMSCFSEDARACIWKPSGNSLAMLCHSSTGRSPSAEAAPIGSSATAAMSATNI